MGIERLFDVRAYVLVWAVACGLILAAEGLR